MCGVAGIWRFNSIVDHDEIKSFTDSMFHRGPDGAGYEVFEKDNIALGHRRLSILDLSYAGKQPMSYADGRYHITFNGEIYNFIEIREELRSKDFSFKTETDTEVILAAYIAWGKQCFKKFNGMWAIGIWDNSEKELILCRDRFGVKPLHYCYLENQSFSFASETIAFKYLKNYTRSYERSNLIRAMHNHNELEPVGETIYSNIKQLLPGSFMIVKKKELPKTEYWWNTLENLVEVPSDFEKQKEKFLELLADSCKLRLRSDVPIASALSGGIDSTAVYCMINWVMKNFSNKRIPADWQKAFSISFPGSEVDERKYVEKVLEQTKGTGIITEPEDSNITQELIESTKTSDLISGTPLSCLTYVYKSMHNNGIVVSMDGHGVDEYLYGYRSSVSKALLMAYINDDSTYCKTLEDTLKDMSMGQFNPRIFENIKQEAKYLSSNKYKLKRTITGVRKIMAPKDRGYHLYAFNTNTLFNKEVIAGNIYPDVINFANRNKNLGEQQLINEFHYNDLPYNLRDFDRGAMQNQIEIRMPFMDYRLVAYTLSLPQKSKLNNGYTKYILREAMKGIMPEEIRTRKLKIGLGAPLKDWFNNGLNSFLVDLINSNKKDVSFLNWNAVKDIVYTNCSNKSWSDSSASQVWPIINYLLLEL